MLRNLLQLGRSTCLLPEQAQTFRFMAAAPKQTLDQYVEGLRNEIADAYSQRVTKYDSYIAAFEKYVATTGLPRASDFAGVKAFAQKRAEMLKQVGFPEDWKVRGEAADKIREMLKEVPKSRTAAAASGSAPWYNSLTDAQLAECDKDPQLFVELNKLHSFEEQFALASQAQAAKFGLPPITLDDLPATMEPMGEYTISANEVKWIMEKTRSHAEALRKSDPRFSDPFNTPDFKQTQERIAERLGMTPAQLEKAQKFTSEKDWRAAAKDSGLAL